VSRDNEIITTTNQMETLWRHRTFAKSCSSTINPPIPIVSGAITHFPHPGLPRISTRPLGHALTLTSAMASPGAITASTSQPGGSEARKTCVSVAVDWGGVRGSGFDVLGCGGLRL